MAKVTKRKHRAKVELPHVDSSRHHVFVELADKLNDNLCWELTASGHAYWRGVYNRLVQLGNRPLKAF
jgi:hypothetical protein